VTEIEKILGNEIEAFQVHQIKSKFASLRVYYSLSVPEPEGERLPARVTPHAGGYTIESHSRYPKRRALDEAIALAGLASEKACEACGAHGCHLPAHRSQGIFGV